MQWTTSFAATALSAAIAAIAMPAAAEDPPIDAAVPSEPAAPSGAAELAKKLSNPIANLISVPFQQNFDFGIGPSDGWKATLNVQPVVPLSVSKDWNVIVRTIVPIAYLDMSTGVGDDTEFGLGDTVQSFFFSPKQPGASGIVWGVGPAFLYPTATSSELGGEKWGAGPTIVLLKQSKGWTTGFLGNHIWSVAGDDDRPDVSQSFLQPFVSHTWPSSVGIALNTESTYNWRTNQWTIPINLSVSRVVRIGKQPVSFAAGARYYAEAPHGGPNWGLRLVMTLLFPKH